MKDFPGRIAVVTGGGTGMGRELVRQLVSEGCNVATCDVFANTIAETKRLCELERLPQGLRITTHIADVSDEAQVQRFRDEVAERQDTDKIHLLFNKAGIGGGSSIIAGSRDSYSRRGQGRPVTHSRWRRRAADRCYGPPVTGTCLRCRLFRELRNPSRLADPLTEGPCVG